MRSGQRHPSRWVAVAVAVLLSTVTATVSPASAATASPQPSKGLAGGACADLARLKVSWYYNWWISPSEPDCTVPGFVPMISGSSTITSGDVSWQLDQLANAGYRTVLGFNEPNKADQSNMSMDQVLNLWPALSANPSVGVGSPSTSGDGQAWFTDFLSKADARGLRIDFLNLHWYGWNAGSCDSKASTFESYLRWAEGLPGNRPIWITEWGCLNQSAPDTATVQRFYTAAVAMLARHPRVERNAFYPYIKNHELFGADGTLTPLGTAFAATPAYH